MRPTRLVVENFFGFAHHDFDLRPIHVGVITGRNGAGKSSIFDAIRYALYGRYRETGDVLIRRGATSARVTLEFTARGSTWRVIREKPRGKTGTLHLHMRRGDEWPEESQHTIAETQARIRDLVGLSYAAFMAGPLMVQENERGDLMALDPRERKALLIEEAEVDGYEPLLAAAKERVAEAEYTLRSVGDRLAAYRVAAADLDAAREAVSAAEAQLDRSTASRDSLQRAVADADAELAAANVLIAGDTALGLREAYLTASVTADRLQLKALEQSRAAFEAHVAFVPSRHEVPAVFPETLAAVKTRVDEIAPLREERSGLVAEKAALRRDLDQMPEAGSVPDVPCHAEGIYATCPLLTAYVWSDERKAEFKTKWNRITDRLTEIEGALGDEREVLASYADLADRDRAHREAESAYAASVAAAERSRAVAKDGLATAQASIKQITLAIERSTAELDDVRNERAKTAEAREASAKAAEDRDVAQTALHTIVSTIRTMDEPALAKARVRLATAESAAEAIPACEAEMAGAGVTRETYSVLVGAFHRDGVPSMVIRGLLPLIEARANEVLARMPEEMSLRLTMGQVTKTGSISDRLDIVVDHEGAETSFAALSGAQQFRVNIALRLGQQRVLAARAGASVDFLFLDEADRDLDEEGVEALMETIAAIRDDFSLILLISHHGWLIDRVPSRIDVTRTAHLSSASIT